MIVLHVHWHPPAQSYAGAVLLFWGETSDTPPGRQRSGRRRAAQPHPFTVPAATALSVLNRLTGLALTLKETALDLQLPATSAAPLPSPVLVHDWDLPRKGKLTLESWRIPTCSVPLADAVPLLQRLPDPEELPPNVRLGDDVRFWQTVTHLALETIAQQKVLPSLVIEEGKSVSAQARWMPVLDGPRDGPRLVQLREAMPPVCRGAVSQQPAPRDLVNSYLHEVTDALARRWGQVPELGKITHESAVDWPHALLRTDASLAGSPSQRSRLAQSHRAWLRSLYAAGDQHFRVAYRLEAPTQQTGQRGNAWILHYLIQARDDPSLLVPASALWQKQTTPVNALGARLENPQDMLLTGLGHTARLFPPLRGSLDEKRPAAAALTSQEAYSFLREAAPLLEASGFGVFVPPWWNKPGMRLGVRLHMEGKQNASPDGGVSAGLVSLENLVNYRWEVALGGETLSREEFAELVALKTPLVQIRGQWVQLDPDQIEAAIRFWEKVGQQGETGLLDAVQMGLGTEAVDGLPVDGVEVAGWLNEWMERFTRREELAVYAEPAGLHATLRPYQQYGFAWLDFQRRWGIGACLADDMGLGKTIQTLAMLLRVKEEQGGLPGPVLLICPTSVVLNWAREAERFSPDLRLLVHQGTNRLQSEALLAEARQMDVVATSYALVRRDGETLKGIDWFGVILDEAQNIKNPETRQARQIRSLPASFRLALTGTPVENHLTELWSIMHFLNPGFLGSYQGFRKHFAIPIERYDDQEAAQRLRRLTAPFILRRVKTDPTVIQDLPEKVETKAYCTLTQEQATLYEAVVQDALQSIESAEEMQRRGLVLSMLMKLKQICNHPAQFLHQIGDSYTPNGEERRSGKLARTAELLEELLAAGDRALIFTQFAEMGGLLRSYIQHHFGVPVLFLHGGTPARQRAQMVERFQVDGDGPRVFVLSLKAGGTGLNLTRACHVLHFDRWWNPAVEDQATDRAFRIGQQRNVQVHKFVCVGTLEEKIDAMIERKKALAESIVGSGEQWLTELSTTDLHNLVALRRDLIG